MTHTSIQVLVQTALALNSHSDLDAYMLGIAERLSFDYYSLTHFVAEARANGNVNLSNFPDTWTASPASRAYWKDCPVAAGASVSIVGFLWSDLHNVAQLSLRQREIMGDARKKGLGEGYTIPMHFPSHAPGAISFAVKRGRPFPFKSLPTAQYLGSFAFDASLRIANGESVKPRPGSLTARQLECIALVAKGKSDWEAAQVLGISRETVHKHIQEAMRRVQVSTRTQLVVRALYESQVRFGDILT